ncbi:MAG: SIMPL domain-containing protein [Sphaerospermopsis sp. SIO1G1]|nr:SIMPL domain-containing protein [Sphaerospermopsis sp. SIO1G1]
MSKNTLFFLSAPTHKLGKTIYTTLLICLMFVLPASAEEKARILRTLTVTGNGVERIPTSLSQVSLGVQIQGKTAQEVQQEVARRSSAVVDFLKSRNVEKLQTTGVRLNPVYSYTNNVQKITGYGASNIVNFRFPTDQVGSLLDETVKIGATRINGISFIATDTAISNAQKQALKKATQDAKDQADAVLSSLGLEFKEIVSIQINNASTPSPIMLQRAEYARGNVADASTPIVGGEQEVRASVTLGISY